MIYFKYALNIFTIKSSALEIQIYIYNFNDFLQVPNDIICPLYNSWEHLIEMFLPNNEEKMQNRTSKSYLHYHLTNTFILKKM